MSGNIVGAVVLLIGFILLIGGSLIFSLGDSFIKREVIEVILFLDFSLGMMD